MKYQSGFGLSLYAVASNGNIYANPRNSKYEEDNLMEVFDQKGDVLKSFGKKIIFKNITFGGFHNRLR